MTNHRFTHEMLLSATVIACIVYETTEKHTLKHDYTQNVCCRTFFPCIFMLIRLQKPTTQSFPKLFQIHPKNGYVLEKALTCLVCSFRVLNEKWAVVHLWSKIQLQLNPVGLVYCSCDFQLHPWPFTIWKATLRSENHDTVHDRIYIIGVWLSCTATMIKNQSTMEPDRSCL